jgi:hypothetical protein
LLILKTDYQFNRQKNILCIRMNMSRPRSDAESFFNPGFSVRLSIELIGKARKRIFHLPPAALVRDTPYPHAVRNKDLRGCGKSQSTGEDGRRPSLRAKESA